MVDNDLEKGNQNCVRPIFRLLTGSLCLLGLYGLYLTFVTQYSMITTLGFSFSVVFSVILSGLSGLLMFSIWVYISGYITINGKLPRRKNT
ncbi:hypothetical protein [Shewanella kaireitica]|uniref:hypothetical protein n=1 Tax=Shewanella kaireitica TaxID=212021 RepID=UPI00200BA338|nr:hypothetical protein [Shewanella kaireitica]MCL1094866.1 hypothetical protein [Shewanella kaireitica]